MNAQRPLRLAEMSRAIGVKSDWLRQEAEAGRIPHLRAGDAYLFDRDTVIRVLSERAKRPHGTVNPQAGREAEGAGDA